MRIYETYVFKYVGNTGKTKKAVFKLVKGKSLVTVKAKLKRENPNSMIHVFVHY